MDIRGGEHGFHCVCDQGSTKADPFLKILDLADIGLKIYTYLASKYAQVAGAAPQKSSTGTDVFILQNTRDKDVPSSNLIQELDANKISCPKCKQVVAHAKRLIGTIPSVNKGHVVAVCDHCRKKVEPRYTCEVCEKIMKKFISAEDKRNQQRPHAFGRSVSDFDIKNISSTPKRMKYGSLGSAAGYKPKWADNLLEIRKEFENKLIPCFVKSQHESGERDELRKQFQKASLIRSRSETFLNAVSGLTEEILDKTFQYYFPKGNRQIITGKGVTSEEFIKDTQEKYRLITEAREKIHEGTRRSATALELGSEEYYDQHGQPIRVGKMPEVYYDEHGQLVRRGKTPHVYYDKYGQPIRGGIMPDIYYDKYGQPVQGRRMPEVFYDEHGQPVPTGRTPEVHYDKHGQPISRERIPEVYYDKYGQPITEVRTPEVYYDKHGRPIPREQIPEVYYDKHGQPITEFRTPEVYYDKHGQPIPRERLPEVYYDKHGQPIPRERTPEVYYDKHGQPNIEGRIPEVYYDKHGQPIPRERIPEVYYDKHGQPQQRGKPPEVYYDKHGQPISGGRIPEVYYDKHGQPLPRERIPEVYYDKHGQPQQRGKPPEVYYDKHGQPIPGGRIPEVYYDKHGQPIPRERIPEVYYDKHGQPQQRGKPPEVYYDKHGQPIPGGRIPEVYYDKRGQPLQRGKTPEVLYDKQGHPIKAAEVYYDEHGHPVTRAKIPEVFYDKHGQSFTKDILPDVHYDKHGQFIQGKRTPDIYYDKHGRPVQRDQARDDDKDGHATHGERVPKAYHDEHARPVQIGRKGGEMSEVFYDQHGKSVRGGRKSRPETEMIYDQGGKSDQGHADKIKGTSPRRLFSPEKPESRKRSAAQPTTEGGSEFDDKSRKRRMGRDEKDAKESERKNFEDKDKIQKPSKGDKIGRTEQSAIELEKTKPQKLPKVEKKITDEKKSSYKDDKAKKVIEDKITQIPSKNEVQKGKKIVDGKDKLTQIPSKDEKNIPSEDKKISKIMDGKDETTQIHSKGEKHISPEKGKADKRETVHQEKPTDKSKTPATEAVKTSTEKEKPKSKEEELKKHKELDDKNKIKDTPVKGQKSVKISGDELKDKDINRKELAEDKVKQKDGKVVGHKQKEEKQPHLDKRKKGEKPESEKGKALKQDKQQDEKKSKGSEHVFEDKLKEAKRQREDKLNQEKANIQKQKEEKENAEKLKAERLKDKEGKTRKQKENPEDKLVKKALDQQAKEKLEAEKMKKANQDQIQKIKDALSKATPQPLKVSEGTQKPEKPEITQPFKIDEKLVSKSTKLVKKKSIETPNKELDIKAIQLMRPSNDDFLAKLVTVKPTKNILVPKINAKELEILGKFHKGHADDGLKDSQCDLCVYSELLLQLEELKEKKLMNEKKEVIIGNEVKKINAKDFAKVKEEIQGGPVPALFKTMFTIEPTAEEYEKKSPEEPLVEEPPKLKPKPNALLQQQTEQDTKGVIKYALSDRTFIDKGWTLLPTEKVVRKMNVYRMRPAHPEFDWFEHNKNKRYLEYDSGDKLAEIDDNGRGRWYYRNGRVALDYYDAEETNAQQRFVIYSSGEPDERGRTHPYTVLATFDYLGNGIVFDHGGKIRLKYNQSEGVVLDRTLGPVSHWKWHSLNDPPVLQQVMIDTQMSFKDPEILKLGDQTQDTQRQDNEEMLAIEFDNFIKEKSKKLTQKFKPFQIKMKALKINEQFSLRILDQATIYLLFRDGSTNLKLNMGMLLDHQEIVDTDTAEMGDVANTMEKLPARTDSIAALQADVSNAQREARLRLERDRRLCPPVPRCSADLLTAAASRRVRQPIAPARSTSGSTSAAERHCICRKPPYNNNLYYDTRII